MKKKILIVAGEKSGDILGSKIIDCLDRNLFDISIVGGPQMEENGKSRSLFPMNDLAVMGIFELLPRLFKFVRRIKETAKFVLETSQDVLLTIDSPDFCFRVAKMVKKLDKENRVKTFHFIAPSVWFYRKGRAKKIAKLYNGLFCILPFEPPYFEKYGLKTIFVGHPIFGRESAEYGFSANGSAGSDYKKDSKIISLTPGSRITEIRVMLPLLLSVAARLRKNYDFSYSILANEDMDAILRGYLKERDISYIDVVSDPRKKMEIMGKSLLAIAKSGTNTLEIAAYSVPMVVVYRFNFLTNLIASLFLRTKSGPRCVNLINILTGRKVIPEFLLFDCKAKNVAKDVIRLIEDEEARVQQVRENLRALESLGYGTDSSPSQLIADEIRRSLAL
ncbi:MAG: lipid-A-disaccharide synthase [Rickettsiales bacterium]|jgi:lipid-A-disaccharide synthase|nr:lipid-A-disaccharide synthase [Rickettsiales bacterium]